MQTASLNKPLLRSATGLTAVALTTRDHQVVEVIGPALDERDNMVHVHRPFGLTALVTDMSVAVEDNVTEIAPLTRG